MLVNIHNIYSTLPSIIFKTPKNLPVSGSEFLGKKSLSSFQATVDSDILSKLIVRTGAGYILREVHHLWRERERVLTSRNCIIKTTKMPEGGNMISINTKTADKTELG